MVVLITFLNRIAFSFAIMRKSEVHIPGIYFVTTLNCTAECGHCYLSAGPGKAHTTISHDDFVRVINHLPKKSCDLTIAGGEVFTMKNQLYAFLNYIKEENSRREKNRKGKIIVELQTNGFWAKTTNKIKRTLEELADLGVSSLDISSYDKHHEAAGINQYNLEMLQEQMDSKLAELEDMSLLTIPLIEIRGASPHKYNLMPIGRANNFKVPLSRLYCDFDVLGCKNFLKEGDVNIREDGSVYACCFSLFKLPGNIFEDSLEVILARAAKDKKFQALDAQGIKGLALLDGYSAKQINSSIKKMGKCGFCYSEYVRTGKAA
ncbi:4Fe-4S cluster-binding domain-containing protein [Candidatus Woesearchaeota archaeon]|nr:4Fe-4S cluster-binding domain-containing protein [Candidatus Woesearchaeota archaeon]